MLVLRIDNSTDIISYCGDGDDGGCDGGCGGGAVACGTDGGCDEDAVPCGADGGRPEITIGGGGRLLDELGGGEVWGA
ncbi:hypothetical protein FO519_007268 [Halicephalobus sp. NKZ332]|nr:hypothetical protein FO519_007268 [Halicephalobus sp. NKZ332]